MDFRQALFIILAFGFLAPGLSYAISCSAGTLADTCTVSSQTTSAGETVSGSGNIVIPIGVTLTVPSASSLTISMGGSVSIQGAITGAGSTGAGCGTFKCSAGAGTNGAAIAISASSITISGALTTNGGDGGSGGSNSGYGGAGGSAGSVSISADEIIFTGNSTSKGGIGGSSTACGTPCPIGGNGGNGGTNSISAGSTVFTGNIIASGGSPGTAQGGSGTAGTAGGIAVTYGQFYSGSGSYSPKMRITLTLKDGAGAALSGVPLTVYQEGTNTTKCSGSTGAGTGMLTCDIQTANATNLDIYATGGGPKSAKLTVQFFNASNNTVDTYIGASGDRRLTDLRQFALNLKDYSGAGVDGGKLTVKDASGNTVCTASTIKYSTLDGDAYCRVAGYSYPSSGKSTLKYDLSLDTNGAYQNDPVTFNNYVARDAAINVGGAHKYLPKHTSLLFVDKTPIEIRYFPSATSQDFIFNDSIPAGFSFSGNILITKHTSGGAQSCSYAPSGTAFSIGSGQCPMLSASTTPGSWFELMYNTTTPSVPPNTTQGYTIPAGYISYLS